MKTLQDFVLIEPIERKSKAGILVPELSDLDPTNKGKILSIGNEAKLGLKVGDIVLFKPHLFDIILIDKKNYLIGREEAIFVVC